MPQITTLCMQLRRKQITLDAFRRQVLVLLSTDAETENLAIDVETLAIQLHEYQAYA